MPPSSTLTTADSPPRSDRGPLTRTLGRWGGSGLLSGILVLVVVVQLITTPAFGRWANIANILQQNSIIGIVACGMLLMIILGGFDLSVGAVGAMTSTLAAALIVHSGTAAGIVVAILAGLLVGAANGAFVALLGMSPFVVTLGTQSVVLGGLFVATQAKPVYGVPESFTQLGLGRLAGIPIVTLVFVAVVVAIWALLRHTRFGHYIYAVGGNPQAARLAGVGVTWVTIGTYAIGGTLAGVGGILLLAQTGIGQPSSASTWALSAIAAVVVGGVPLSGGVGKVSAVVLGTFLLGVVANALNLNGVSSYWQPAVTGAVILVAVGVDSYQRRRRALR